MRYFLILLFLVTGTLGLGQTQDAAVTIPVTMELNITGKSTLDWYYDNNDSIIYFYAPPEIGLTISGESTQYLENSQGTDNGMADRKVIQIKPGKAYTITLSYDSNVYDYSLNIDSPAGYRVIFDNVEKDYFYQDLTPRPPGIITYRVRIESDEMLAAGESSSLRPDVVLWKAGLGSLPNGRTAGVISLREDGLSSSTFTPSALIFETSTSSVKRWPLTGPLQQIDAPQCIVRIESVNSHTYRLIYYPRSGTESTQAGTGTRLVPNTSPWLEYEITDPNSGTQNPATQLRILKRIFVEHALDVIGEGSGTTTVYPSRTSSGVKSWWTQIERVGAMPNWTTVAWTDTSLGTVGDSKIEWLYNVAAGTENILIKNSAGTPSTNTLKLYQTYTWGSELKTETVGNTLANSAVTQYDYHTTATAPGNYMKPKWIINPSGQWTRYDYNDTLASRGKVSRVYSPFLDTPTAPASATATMGEVTDYTYGFTDWNGKKTLPTQTITKINNVQTARSVIGYDQSQTRNLQPVTVATLDRYTDATNYVRTVTTSYRQDVSAEDRLLPGLVHSVKKPDGTMTVSLYLKGTYNESSRSWTYGTGTGDLDWEDLEIHGTTLTGGATSAYTAYLPAPGQRNSTESTFRLSPNQSYATYIVRDRLGRERMRGRRIFVNNGWVDVDRTHSDYVSSGGLPAGPYLTRRLRDNGPGTALTIESQQGWAGGLLVAERDRHGTETLYTHTPGGRVATRLTFSSLAGFIEGNLREHYTYDAAGNLLSTRRQASTTPDTINDIVSSATYDLGGRILTSSTPGPAGPLTTSYSYYYGNYQTNRVIGPNGADRILTTYRDGRTKTITGTAVVAEAHGYTVAANGQITLRRDLGAANSGYNWSSTTADWLNRPVIETKPTTAVGGTHQTRYFYNASGQRWKEQATNSSGTGLLAPILATYDDMGQLVASGTDLDENGSLTAASTDRYSTFNNAFTYLDSHWWSASETWAYHTNGSASASRVSKVLQRLTGCTCNDAETRSYDAADQVTIVRRLVDRTQGQVSEITALPGASNTGTVTSRYGFTLSSSTPGGAVTASVYDAYGRLKESDGRDNLVSSTTYFPGTSFARFQRTSKPTAPATQQDMIEFAYDAAGLLAERKTRHDTGWASTWFSYNLRGELLRQWGTADNPVEYAYDAYGRRTDQWTYRNSSAFTTATWPTGQTGDRTQFGYDTATFLQTSRTDAASKVTSYLFDALNRVSRRTLARGNYAVYTYRDATGQRTGEPWKTQYYLSGGAVDTTTPVVELASTRDGLPASVIDGTGTRTFEYDATTRRSTAEVLPAYFGSNRRLTTRYDGPVPGRAAGWRFHDTVDHLDLGYAYQTASGRLEAITSTARVGAQIYGAHAFTYSYASNSDLIAGVTQGSISRQHTWASWGDVASTWTTSYAGSPIAAFAYDYDDTARRTGEKLTGTLATSLGYTANGYRDAFTPNARSETTALRRHLLDAAGQPTSTETVSQRRDWSYDALGNRLAEIRSSGTTNYTVNNLNQYSALTGWLPDTLAHDFDGNRTSDATWNNYYDGENRLVSQVKKDNTQRLDYAYDYAHRRVAKVVRSGSTLAAPITKTLRFVHQGYSIAAELDGSTLAVVRSYTWGLDLTGTVGGGGGVGGLLQIHDAASRYQPLYNANGNVRGLITADAFPGYAAGAVVAAYDYTVFGELTATIGTAAIAQANPIRFASKYLDAETGLYDYNHRFYDPLQGRFINRDPIGEMGGLNLYAYVRNNAPARWDLLGMGMCDDGNGGFGAIYCPSGFSAGYDANDEAFYQRSLGTVSTHPQGSRGLSGSSHYSASDVGGIDAVRAQRDENIQQILIQDALSNNTAPNSATGASGGLIPLAPIGDYVRNGSKLGNGLSQIPILGYVLGPLGDVLSGTGNLLAGNFSRGFSQIGYGARDFTYTTARDAAGFAIGMTYGKAQAIAYNIDRGSVSGVLKSLIIPHHDAMLGADWGIDPARPQDNTPFMGHTKLDYASRTHDYNSYRSNEEQTRTGPYHAQWIADSWGGTGSEPGVFGQAIRMIGTPSFFIFSLVD